ncbi:MAG: translation initiation factor IF-3, partial [Parcubacteria group bacterium Gr01-1014_48]
LDLIEIAPTASPPVCKIMDFGKFKYDREKGEREHSKKQKESGIKGVRIGFTTGIHDLAIRAQQVEKFLKGGDKVRVQMRLFGRQKAHGDLAFKKFQEFLSIIPIPFDLEMPPKRLPQGYIAVLIKK